MKQISVNELYECLKQDLNLVLIDVRSLDEYRIAVLHIFPKLILFPWMLS
jgi:rhodanese-related sulfurtransferase